MTDWSPDEVMDEDEYERFKNGEWVEVPSVPEWVSEASNPPKKTEIPPRGEVSATFRGDNLEYEVVTKRTVPPGRGVGTGLRVKYRVHIRGKEPERGLFNILPI